MNVFFAIRFFVNVVNYLFLSQALIILFNFIGVALLYF